MYLYRLAIGLFFLSITSSIEAQAQCSPTGASAPIPAVMVYASHVFHIPKVWPLSDGTGRRTKDDCDEVQRRFESENGRGVVTDAINEFQEQLKLACARQGEVRNEWVKIPRGDLCLVMSEVSFTPRSFGSPGEFCKNYISTVSVVSEKVVVVIFDETALPCDRNLSETILYCVGEDGPYSPDVELGEIAK